jgi:hypothetical protein
VSDIDETGVHITTSQARELDGVLAGASGATQALHQIAGRDVREVRDAVSDAFVSALGSSLKLSAALVLLGLILTIVLMRRSEPVDEPAAPVPAPPTRPAPIPPGAHDARADSKRPL